MGERGAGHAWGGDDEADGRGVGGGATGFEGEDVAGKDGGIGEALGEEVFADGAEGEVGEGVDGVRVEFGLECVVVFDGVEVEGLVFAAVVAFVGLIVALEAQGGEDDGA